MGRTTDSFGNALDDRGLTGNTIQPSTGPNAGQYYRQQYLGGGSDATSNYTQPGLGPTYQYQQHGDYMPGRDDAPWGHVTQPSAYEYGQQIGGAQAEEGRYAGLGATAMQQPGAQIDNGRYNADRGLEMGSRGNQDYALGQYRNMIEGNGPSVAQAQMQRGLAASNAQQASIAASARGGGANLAAAQQAASNAAGNASGNIVGQMGLARVQEQLGALQGYSGLATSQRAADLQRQGLSAEQAYRQAQLEEQQQIANQSTQMGYEQMRQKVFEDQNANRQAGEAANSGVYLANQQNATANRQINQQETNALISGGLAAGGAVLAAASDVRAKKNIGDGAPAVRQQMSAMQPYTYQYTDPGIPGAGPGQRVGVMAQDMERGPYGSQLVKDSPTGKKIDGPGGLSLALAAGADHEQRLRALEGRIAKDREVATGKGPYAERNAARADYMAARAEQHGGELPGAPLYSGAPSQGLVAALGPSGTALASDAATRSREAAGYLGAANAERQQQEMERARAAAAATAAAQNAAQDQAYQQAWYAQQQQYGGR